MTAARNLKIVLGTFAVTLGFVGLRTNVESFRPAYVFRKDFVQEYLLAKAVLSRTDPYRPLPELAARLVQPAPALVLQHATPHPPPVAVLSVPLALFTYEHAAMVWFLLEIAFTFVSIYLLLRCLDEPPPLGRTIVLTLFALGWAPFREGLWLGQLNTLSLLLLVCAWLALRSNHAILGGSALGCVLALKLTGWPILLFLALGRWWRAVGAAVAVVIAFNVAAAAVMGFDTVMYYYLKVAPVVWPLYRTNIGNISAWAFGWRAFVSTSSIDPPAVLAPLIFWPALARFVSLGVPITLLAIGLVLAARARSVDASLSVMVCVSLLINPVAWSHHLAMMALPIGVVVRRLVDIELPKTEVGIAVALGALLSITRDVLEDVSFRFAHVTSLAALSTFVTAGAVIGLLWFVWRLDRMGPADRRSFVTVPAAS